MTAKSGSKDKSLDLFNRRRQLNLGKLDTDNFGQNRSPVSGFTFFLFILFNMDYFLHFEARIPALGALHPAIILVGLIIGLLLLQKDKLKGRGKNDAFKSIFYLIVYIFVSLPLVSYPGSVIRDNMPAVTKAFVFLFFTGLIIDTPKRLKIFVFVFVACEVFRGLEPLYLHITQGYWGSKTYIGEGQFAKRLAGAPTDYVNPNGLGFVIVTSVPYLYYLLWGSSKWRARLVYLLVFPALLYALILTMSRGAMIAFLVVAYMVFKESRHKLAIITITFFALIIGWMNLSPIHKDRYLSVFDSNTREHRTAVGRWNLTKEEFAVGMERPIFGHGIGTAGEAKYHYSGQYQVSHNLYTELLIEVGLIGFIIFVRYMRSVYRTLKINRYWFEVRRNKEECLTKTYEYRLNQALTAVFWMYVVYSINYWGLTHGYWYLFGGLCVALGRHLNGIEALKESDFSTVSEKKSARSKSVFKSKIGT